MGANLGRANLQRADFKGACVEDANLKGAKLPATARLPKGDLIGWKKLCGDVIAQLKIPAKAHRTASLTSNKCRAEYVVVVALYGTRARRGTSAHDGTEYRVGCVVTPDSYDDDLRVACTHGIHFFRTRKEAEEWRT
jgi:hypothetical protein